MVSCQKMICPLKHLTFKKSLKLLKSKIIKTKHKLHLPTTVNGSKKPLINKSDTAKLNIIIFAIVCNSLEVNIAPIINKFPFIVKYWNLIWIFK